MSLAIKIVLLKNPYFDIKTIDYETLVSYCS